MAQKTAIHAQKAGRPAGAEIANPAEKSRGRPAAASLVGKKPTGKASRPAAPSAETATPTTDDVFAPALKKPGTAETKASIVLKKLGSTKGATIEVMMDATGWQAHSVRGFLSAVVKKKLGHNLVTETGKDGLRRYRIQTDGKSG